jgi:hypothetical protein
LSVAQAATLPLMKKIVVSASAVGTLFVTTDSPDLLALQQNGMIQ